MYGWLNNKPQAKAKQAEGHGTAPAFQADAAASPARAPQAIQRGNILDPAVIKNKPIVSQQSPTTNSPPDMGRSREHCKTDGKEHVPEAQAQKRVDLRDEDPFIFGDTVQGLQKNVEKVFSSIVPECHGYEFTPPDRCSFTQVLNLGIVWDMNDLKDDVAEMKVLMSVVHMAAFAQLRHPECECFPDCRTNSTYLQPCFLETQERVEEGVKEDMQAAAEKYTVGFRCHY